MNVQNKNNQYPFVGSRAKTYCSRVGGVLYCRPQGNVTPPPFYIGNYSVIGNRTEHYKFSRCKTDRCKLKCNMDSKVVQSNHFRSNYNNNSYTIRTNENLNCKSTNVIYLITCKLCGLQYVGKTQRSFEIRTREHLDKIRKQDKSQHIYAHFQSDRNHIDTPIEELIEIQIIEKVYSEDTITTDKMRQRRTK